jgi:hypothetical protein
MAYYNNDFISRSLINENDSKVDIFDEMDFLHKLMEEEDFNNLSNNNRPATPIAPCNTPVNINPSYDNKENNIYVPRIITSRVIDSEDYMSDVSYTNQPIVTEEMFKHPPKSSKDAYYVWKDANLPKYASKSLIESELTKWAIQNAFINSSSNPDTSEWTITWKTKSGVSCTSKFTTFIKWMLCACSRQSQV